MSLSEHQSGLKDPSSGLSCPKAGLIDPQSDLPEPNSDILAPKLNISNLHFSKFSQLRPQGLYLTLVISDLKSGSLVNKSGL